MNTPLIDDPNPTSEKRSEPLSLTPPPRFSPRRRGWIAGGLAAATLLAVAGAVILGNLGGGDGDEVAAPPVELALSGGDVMASCMPFDTAILADMSPAFAATATEVTDGTVTLDVDRWYAGGDADTVVLAAQHGMQALIDGFDFEVGRQYLITAAQGTVNFCGYSGPATPELTAAFESAFGG